MNHHETLGRIHCLRRLYTNNCYFGVIHQIFFQCCSYLPSIDICCSSVVTTLDFFNCNRDLYAHTILSRIDHLSRRHDKYFYSLLSDQSMSISAMIYPDSLFRVSTIDRSRHFVPSSACFVHSSPFRSFCGANYRLNDSCCGCEVGLCEELGDSAPDTACSHTLHSRLISPCYHTLPLNRPVYASLSSCYQPLRHLFRQKVEPLFLLRATLLTCPLASSASVAAFASASWLFSYSS